MSNFYNFGKYLNLDRWNSYWYQIFEILDLKPESVLEIGIGDGVVSDYIKKNYPNINYKSADFEEKLNPDIILNLRDEKLDIPNVSFDIVCAFEVLEHLPFDRFENILMEFSRISKKYIIISLPYWGRHFSFAMKLPFFKKIKFQFKSNFLAKKHIINSEHFWEIGKRDYSMKKIKKCINNKNFKILKKYICFESPYHYFLVLEKKHE